MANFDKFTRGACGHMLKHYERSKDENGEYVKFGNQDIDPSRSHLNYNLGPERKGSQYGFIKARCAEVHCMNRKDINVLGSWVVTAPEDLPPNELKKFFQKSYDFLEKKYGKENVVSAYVHMDESGRPHMHFAFVPVVQDQKRDRYKVNAKQCVTRKELLAFHPALQEYLEGELGHPVAILNEATKEGNKTVTQLKQERETKKQAEYAAETAAALQEAENARAELEKVKAELEAQRATNETLRAENEALRGDASQLQKQLKEGIKALDESREKRQREEDRVKELRQEIKKNEDVLDDQLEMVDHYSNVLHQISDHESYIMECDATLESMDAANEVLDQIPKLSKIMKTFQAIDIAEYLKEQVAIMLGMVNATLQRLQIFEIRRQMALQNRKSGEIRKRSMALEDRISRDANRAGSEHAATRETTREQGR